MVALILMRGFRCYSLLGKWF